MIDYSKVCDEYKYTKLIHQNNQHSIYSKIQHEPIQSCSAVRWGFYEMSNIIQNKLHILQISP